MTYEIDAAWNASMQGWWSSVTNGDIMTAVINSYTYTLGDLFFVIIFGIVALMIYFRTQNFLVTGVACMLISSIAAGYYYMIGATSGVSLILFVVSLIPLIKGLSDLAK